MQRSNITYLGEGFLADSVITADSTPEYDIPFWPLDSAWDCHDWMTWHKRLKEKYGQDEANARFLEAWNKQSFWEWNQSFCKYGGEFVDYFAQQNLDAGNFVSKITRNLTEAGVNLSKGANSLSSSLTNLNIGTVLTVAGLGAGAYTLFVFSPVIKRKLKSMNK